MLWFLRCEKVAESVVRRSVFALVVFPVLETGLRRCGTLHREYSVQTMLAWVRIRGIFYVLPVHLVRSVLVCLLCNNPVSYTHLTLPTTPYV